MPKTNRQLIAERFIVTLTSDVNSGIHSIETNQRALYAAIELLKNHHLHPQLSIAQIVRGTLNMVFASETLEYNIFTEESLGKDKFDEFVTEFKRWFADYNNQLQSQLDNGIHIHRDIAIPVIERASQASLYMATKCAGQTLALYFEYLNQVDSTIEPPKLALPPSAAYYSRVIEIFTSQINKFKDEDAVVAEIEAPVPEAPAENAPVTSTKDKTLVPNKQQFLDTMLKDLTVRIEQLKLNSLKHKNSLEAAEELRSSLSAAVDVYRSNVSSSPGQAREDFVADSEAAIQLAMPKLEKELGWGDYLANLLLLIANAFLSNSNAIFHSNYTLFTPEKAPGVVEVEEIQKNLTDWSKK